MRSEKQGTPKIFHGDSIALTTTNKPLAGQKKGRSRGIVNVLEYTESPMLNIKKFPEMSDEWLDFIAICRSGKHHDYDIVEGPMADDTIWNYVNDFLSGDISREAFWALAKFKHPTHQISFHTEVALKCLSFKKTWQEFPLIHVGDELPHL